MAYWCVVTTSIYSVIFPLSAIDCMKPSERFKWIFKWKTPTNEKNYLQKIMSLAYRSRDISENMRINVTCDTVTFTISG